MVRRRCSHGDGIKVGREKMFDAQPGWVFDAGRQRLRPGQTTVAVRITNARIARRFVEHEHVRDAVAVEIAVREKFDRGLLHKCRADVKAPGPKRKAAEQREAPNTNTTGKFPGL